MTIIEIRTIQERLASGKLAASFDGMGRHEQQFIAEARAKAKLPSPPLRTAWGPQWLPNLRRLKERLRSGVAGKASNST